MRIKKINNIAHNLAEFIFLNTNTSADVLNNNWKLCKKIKYVQSTYDHQVDNSEFYLSEQQVYFWTDVRVWTVLPGKEEENRFQIRVHEHFMEQNDKRREMRMERKEIRLQKYDLLWS